MACCCGLTCASLINQNEITLQITCEDITRYVVETVTQNLFTVGGSLVCAAGHQRGHTRFFPGNDYAGTFTLTRAAGGGWEYVYPLAAPVCSNIFSGARPRIKLIPLFNCNFRLIVELYALFYCDWSQAVQRARGDFDCIWRTPLNECSGESSAVAVGLGADTTITLNLSGSSPYFLSSFTVDRFDDGDRVCGGNAQVTRTGTTTGSRVVSVSLLG